jgi:hypothetical protein
MNRQIRHLSLLSVVLLAGCGRIAGGPEREITINRQWPASEVEKLAVTEVDGNVSVEAATGDQITLVAKVRGRELDPKPQVENQGLFLTQVSGDTLRIGRKQDRKFEISDLFDRNKVHIDYVLRVPAAVSLDLQTVNGRIATRGMDSETEATSVNGTIDVETMGSAELYATTVNGRVKATFLREFQGAKFRTVNGAVEAILPTGASFAVDLSQVNGDFEASFPLTIRSNPGSRRVSGEVNGGRYDLKIVTVNGDVALSSGPTL